MIRFNDNKIRKLRNLKKSDPREYWNTIINCDKHKVKSEAPLNDFYEFSWIKFHKTWIKKKQKNSINHQKGA